MNIVANFEHRASSSRGKHEGESSFALCDRLGRTRDNSQRQLPTDHDYAVPTREYQTDQSSHKTAPAAARSVLEKTQRHLQKHPHRFRSVDMVTPYQGNALRRTCARLCHASGGELEQIQFLRDMSRFKQPSDTLAASSGFGRRSMIASESNQIP